MTLLVMEEDDGSSDEKTIFDAALDNDPYLLAICISRGETLDDTSVDHGASTPLHIACAEKNVIFLQAALSYDFDPFIKNSEGFRAIDIARKLGLYSIQEKILEKMYPEANRSHLKFD